MRRFHGFCISPPRSGTHSIAYIFEKACQSAHEPFSNETIQLILGYYKGEVNKQLLEQVLKSRDSALELELDASHYLHHFIETLVQIFPESRYVLTVRDPVSWLQSEINQNIFTSDPEYQIWQMLEENRYGCYKVKRPDYESELALRDNVWPIESYLRYWADHNTMVLNHVPKERLLTFSTNEIEQNLDRMCTFFGVEDMRGQLDLQRSRSGLTDQYIDIYSHVDKKYVSDLIEKHCSEVISRLTDIIPTFAQVCMITDNDC